MQMKKESLRQDILKAAEVEFLNKGFENASLRNIASTAGISTGMIYTYFLSKDDLFKTIVKPAADRILEEASTGLSNDFEEFLDYKSMFTRKSFFEGFRKTYKYIWQHRNLFRLLTELSTGSTMENFTDQVSDAYSLVMERFLEVLSDKGIFSFTTSKFSLHIYAHLTMGLYWEMLKHEIDYDDSEVYISEVSGFIVSGWADIFELTEEERNADPGGALK